MGSQVPTGVALLLGEAVAKDNLGETEFCSNMTDPNKDFAFGLTIPICIPKEVTTKRDWRGVNKASLPTFLNM